MTWKHCSLLVCLFLCHGLGISSAFGMPQAFQEARPVSFGPSEFVSQMSQPDPAKLSGGEGDGQKIQHNIWLQEQGERGNALAFFFPQWVEKIEVAHDGSQVHLQANGYGNAFVGGYITFLSDIFSNTYKLHWKVGLFWALFLITILSLSDKIKTKCIFKKQYFSFSNINFHIYI